MATSDEIRLTSGDMRSAVDQGVIDERSAAQLLAWYRARQVGPQTELATTRAREHPKGMNLVTVAYYSGAMLMISACACTAHWASSIS